MQCSPQGVLQVKLKAHDAFVSLHMQLTTCCCFVCHSKMRLVCEKVCSRNGECSEPSLHESEKSYIALTKELRVMQKEPGNVHRKGSAAVLLQHLSLMLTSHSFKICYHFRLDIAVHNGPCHIHTPCAVSACTSIAGFKTLGTLYCNSCALKVAFGLAFCFLL